MIFPYIEETRTAVESTPISNRDIATQCFLDLLTWFRVIVLQDAVFLQKQFPQLNLWNQSPFNDPMFEEFSKNLLYEASFGQDLKFVQIAKAMPKMAEILRGQQQDTMATLSAYHQSSERHRNQIQTQLKECTDALSPVSQIIGRLYQGGIHMRTQVTLDDVTMPSTTSTLLSNPSNPVGALTASESTQVSEDPIVQYRLDANVRTIPRLWEEYDQGIVSTPNATRGPSIRTLNDRFGVKWRRVDPYRKQYARRRHIWEAILRVSKNLEIAPEIAAQKMERWRRNHDYTLNKVNECLSAVTPDMPGPWGQNDIDLRHIV